MFFKFYIINLYMPMQACIKKLQKITGAKEIIFSDRCNVVILAVLRALKNKSIENLIIQNEGGWLTYPQFAKRLKYNLFHCKTNNGIIEPNMIKNLLVSENIKPNKTAILINSLPAYAFQTNMKELYHFCKEQEIILINDVSGSIGLPIGTIKYSDLIVGSFGPAKPVNLGVGGFFAFTDNNFGTIIPEMKKTIHYDVLLEKLESLPQRINFLTKKSEEIKKEMKDFEVVMPDQNGINVIVKYSSETEKENITKYCNLRELEYTECPRYIRINEKAISIEVKRL